MTQKISKSTWVYRLCTIHGPWDCDEKIKSKLKQIIKSNFQSNTILNDKFGKKKSIKKKKKKWVNWIYSPNLRPESWDKDKPIKTNFTIEGLMIWVMKWRWLLKRK
jgi:hypothetical protein